MATANERLRDFSISHQIGLVRLSNRQQRELSEILSAADGPLTSLLSRTGRSARLTRTRANAIRRRIKSVLDRHQTKLLSGAMSDLVSEVVRTELGVQQSLLRRAGFDLATPAFGSVVSAVKARPFDGDLLRNWTRQFVRNDLDRTWRAVQSGLVSDLTNDEIVRAVIGQPNLRIPGGARQVSRRGLQALVRTVTTHAAATARSQFYEANPDVFAGEVWVATLDARTTVICGNLDGDFFPLGVGPRPPIHISCRSVTSPVLRGVSVPDTVTYEEWLRGRSAAFQDDVLGTSRGRLFRQGEVKLDRFVNDANRELTVAELRRSLPDAFAEVGL